MKYFLIETTPRVVLGLIFLVGSIDGFWFLFTGTHFIHPPMSDRAMEFAAALGVAGFFWPLMKSIQFIGALSLLSNRAPAFGLLLLAPIMTIIVLFHFFLNPQGIPMAVLLAVCGLLLLRAYRWRFAYLFKAEEIGRTL